MRFLLISFCTLAFLNGEQQERVADLSKLRDQDSAFDEVKRLIDGSSLDTKLKRAWIYRAPQRNGEKLTAVLADWAYFFEKEYVGPWGYEIDDPEELFDKDRDEEKVVTVPSLKRIREADIMLFDAEGREVKPFARNVRIESGYVYDFNGDDVLDRAERWHAGGSDGFIAQVFLVGSIERSPRRLLEVIYNCHHEKESELNEWDFRCFDNDKDGLVEIGFGPVGSDLDEVIFDWDGDEKEYRVRGGKEHPHLRVLAEWETASEIVPNFRYPILPEKREPISKNRPYCFVSLKREEHEKYREFFNGRESQPDIGWNRGDWRDDQLPSRLWERNPKKVAMELVELNRTDQHRAEYQLAMDDRDGIEPLESGWIFFNGGLSGVESIHSDARMVRFGAEDSALYAIEWASQKVDHESRYLFEWNYRVRKIDFPAAKAKQLADVVFWLDRVRSRRRDGDNFVEFDGTSHDGFGRLSIYEDGQKPREIGVGSIWLGGSIKGNWKGSYSLNVMLNCVNLLWQDGVRELLKDEQSGWPKDLDRDENQADLARNIRGILKSGESDSLPVDFLESLVQVIDRAGLLELEAEIEILEKSIPAEASPEEKALRRHRRNWNTPEIDDQLDSYPAELEKPMNMLKLEDKLRFDRSWVLRDDLRTTREKFAFLQDAEKLKRAVLENGRYDEWASPWLKSSSLEEWAEVMMEKFVDAEKWEKEWIFRDLAEAHPVAAERLVKQMNAETKRELIFEIVRFRLKNDPKKAALMFPTMMAMVRDPAETAMRRNYTIELISEMKLGPEEERDLREVIKAEVADPTIIKWRESAGELALKALGNLKPREGDLEYYWSQPAFLELFPDEGLAILKKQSPGEGDYRNAAKKYLKLQLSEGTGDVEQIALLALAMDLRELAPLIEKSATEHSGIPDGKGYEMKSGQKFHLSRYVTALWKEKDQETLAKMWIDFMAGQLVRAYEKDGILSQLKEKTREAVTVLAQEIRSHWIDETLSHYNFRDRGKAERWLRSLK